MQPAERVTEPSRRPLRHPLRGFWGVGCLSPGFAALTRGYAPPPAPVVATYYYPPPARVVTSYYVAPAPVVTTYAAPAVTTYYYRAPVRRVYVAPSPLILYGP